MSTLTVTKQEKETINLDIRKIKRPCYEVVKITSKLRINKTYDVSNTATGGCHDLSGMPALVYPNILVLFSTQYYLEKTTAADYLY